MDAHAAEALAERLHRGQLDAGNTPLIDHLRRIAAAVPADARAVAWLHEALEYRQTSQDELLAKGLSRDALGALELLTRHTRSRSRSEYLAHVASIAQARGRAGHLARSVKRADLADRVLHPGSRRAG
jgi:hypothetical protein